MNLIDVYAHYVLKLSVDEDLLCSVGIEKAHLLIQKIKRDGKRAQV